MSSNWCDLGGTPGYHKLLLFSSVGFEENFPYSSDCPKQPRTSFPFYKLFYLTISARNSACTVTPVRTHSISGLKSRVMKLSFLSLKMLVKSGLEKIILKFHVPLQRYLLTCQANLKSFIQTS